MGLIQVAGLDPSLQNLGMVKGVLNTSPLFNNQLTLREIQLVQTKPDNKNKQARKSFQDLERARVLYQGLHRFISDVDAVFVEMPIGSQNAASMKSYGMCIMAIASIGKPLFQISPEEVKKAAVGDKNATKNTMIQWATTKHPEVQWFSHQGKIVAKNEHVADATAAIYAGVLSDQFKQAMVFMGL